MKIKVIINPKSKIGDIKYFIRILKEKFTHSLIGVEQTAYPGHATQIARLTLKENIDTLVLVGGDGTVNEVINGIVGTNVSIGIIPTGTANDLASLYHIPCDVVKACDTILEQCLHHIDVICVNERYYVTAGGIGLPCETACTANKIKHRGSIGKLVGQFLGSKIYVIALLLVLAKKNNQRCLVNIRWDNFSRMVDLLTLMVNNQPFLGKNFLILPGAINNDGLLDICLIKNSKSRIRNLSIIMKVLRGSHIYSPFVERWCTRELNIQTESSLPFFGDGEVFKQASKFRIKILPKALNVIVPKTQLNL